MPEFIPTDPLFAQQWFLKNTGQVSGAVAGFDLNVTQVWPDYTGAGVHIGVYDNGVDYNHPDLNDNYDASRQVTFNGNPTDPNWQASPDPNRYNNLNYHGTEIAGTIAAEANNGIGGVGVAFGAKVTGVLAPIGPNPPDAQLVQALQQLTNFDIATFARTNGPFSDGRGNSNFTSFWSAIDNAVINGRGGLGTILVRGAGNLGPGFGGQDGNEAAFSQDAQLIVVGAVQSSGVIAPYVTRGSNMLVSAFNGYASEGDTHNVVTTDISGAPGQNSGDYTAGGGTSFAHPEVAGVVALMLQANPNLGWRDVQTILANSARHVGSAVGGPANATETDTWQFNHATNWNGGGRHFSNDYGYGTVDALAAVRMAETWGIGGAAAATSANQAVVSTMVNPGSLAIPDNNGNSVSFTFNVASDIRIEGARLIMNITHARAEDLHITLTSPTGTISDIWHPPIGDMSQGTHAFPGSPSSWAFVSQEFRGDQSIGTWTVTITDLVSGNAGSLGTSATLSLRGSTLGLTSTKYVYTNEFSDYADLAGRSTLTDTDAGVDTINAAAVTTASTINLNAGASSTIDGHAMTIAAGSSIENAVGGDGNDILTGNSLANVLYGGRGDDSLDGGAGADTMTGGIGNDTYFVDDTGDGVTENSNQGDDIVYATVDYTLPTNVEAVILQGTANLNAAGNDDVNALIGDAGNNNLDGHGGDDYMVGGAGNDIYFIDSSSDVVVENPGEGSDIVYAALDYTIGSNIEAVVLTGTANLNAAGSDQVNALVGNAGNNNLDGHGGDDYMVGGAGDDIYFVDSSSDVVVENLNEGADIVYASIDYTIGPNVESVVLTGTANLNAAGGNTGNALIGNAGNNALDGRGGGDYLVGNGGNDQFVFGAGEANGDIIGDFDGAGAAVGDSLRFIGYGAGTFTQVDATHWSINSANGAVHDIILLQNGASVHASDYSFA